MARYQCHQSGHWAALYPQYPRASRSSTKPSLRVVQQDWSSLFQPACLSQITITGVEPRVQLDMAGRSKNFSVDTGATYSVLTSYSRAISSQTSTILSATRKTNKKIHLSTCLFLGWTNIFPSVSNSPWLSYSGAFSQRCTILGAIGKTITKRFTWALLCCWDGQIFSHQFLVVPECPTPLLGKDLSLPLKLYSYCSPDRRCFKTFPWVQTNYFYQPSSEITPE